MGGNQLKQGGGLRSSDECLGASFQEGFFKSFQEGRCHLKANWDEGESFSFEPWSSDNDPLDRPS